MESTAGFSLLFAEHFARRADPLFRQEDISYLRKLLRGTSLIMKIFYSSNKPKKRLASDKENSHQVSPVPVKRRLPHRTILGLIQR